MWREVIGQSAMGHGLVPSSRDSNFVVGGLASSVSGGSAERLPLALRHLAWSYSEQIQ
jgi:hypothetical protein